MNTHELNLSNRPQRFPEVDEKNMLKFGKTSYSIKDNVLFTQPQNENIEDRTVTGPKFIKIAELPLNKKIKQPTIDIKHNTFKLPFLSPEEVKELYKPTSNQVIFSVILHVILIALYFSTSYFTNKSNKKPEVVEVTFGLNENAAQTKTQAKKDIDEGEKEATKTIRELPKLTKNITPDTSPIPQKPLQNMAEKPDTLKFREPEKKIKPVENKKEEQVKSEPNKPIGPIPDKDKQKVKLEDYLKRKEMDTRKESSKKDDGVHNKDKEKPEGTKPDHNKLPASPFASPSDIPNSPFAEAPSGVLDGKISSKSYNSYKAYIARQLKLNWSTSEGTSFSASLKTKVKFTINPFGHLLGKAQVVKSSGNQEFDQLVLNSLESTFPVSEAPPKDINPPQTFEANYSAKNVQ